MFEGKHISVENVCVLGGFGDERRGSIRIRDFGLCKAQGQKTLGLNFQFPDAFDESDAAAGDRNLSRNRPSSKNPEDAYLKT